jgi:drug/metabolite transporter (DMT)-like permease
LSLILLSACFHVVPHVALKRARDRTSFVWWLWLWSSVLFVPVLLLKWEPVPMDLWSLLLLSAAFEALYFVSIANAYRTGDLSIVYPLARGTAPLFILVWSIVLVGERPRAAGVLGILCIMAGLYVINLPRLAAWRDSWRSLGQPAARWALLAGLCISVYTTLDKVGVMRLNPILYTYLVMTLTLACLTPWTLRAVGVHGLIDEMRSSGFDSVLAGVFSLAAYGLVLWVMQMGTPVSYAGATREISVVLGVIAGVVFLKEPSRSMRVLGSLTIVLGVAFIALLG